MAYSAYCPEIGYTQGMNYLVALILIGVEMEEVLAFKILTTLMEREIATKFKMQSIYENSLCGLFTLTE
jgi:hypothetical protein